MVLKPRTYCRATRYLPTSQFSTRKPNSTFFLGQLARQLKSRKLSHRLHCCKNCCQKRDGCYCCRRICGAGCCCQSSTCCSGGAAALSCGDRGCLLTRLKLCRCWIFSCSKVWKCLIFLNCVVLKYCSKLNKNKWYIVPLKLETRVKIILGRF